MATDLHISNSNDPIHSQLDTATTAMQAVSKSTSLVEITETTHVNGTQTSDNDEEVATASTRDIQTAEHMQGQQEAYLEPILVAMELGQEILESNDNNDGDMVGEHENEATAVESNTSENTIPTDGDDSTPSMVTITHEQLSNLFANSNSGSTAGNVIVTSLPDGNCPQGSLSIATILQDVASGIQSASTGVGSTTIQADNNGGSYYLVTQGGTIPIVMQSGSAVVNNLNLVNTASGDAFVLNQDSLPEGVFSTSVQSDSVGNSEKVVNTTGQDLNESNDELTTAAAAVEGHKEELQEAITTAPIPVVNQSSGKRRLSNGPRVCNQCNKAFKYPSDLKKHLQIHTDVKKFKCEECNRFFRRYHQLVVHQRIHTGEKPYVCKHCGTAFRHDSTLTMHIRTRHEHKRPFRCEFCDHTFGRLSHLRKHVKKVCGPNRNQKQANTITQCKYCEEIFPNKIDLRKHTATCEKKESKPKDPSQVTLHVCNICNKDFASPYNVRRHQITHSDERPYICEFCRKCFKEKSSLTKHMKRVHKCKTDDSTPCELMVSITSDDQQFEVVSVPANDENILASANAVDTSNENVNRESTVDHSALVHVATSVMVEELLHSDQNMASDPTATSQTSSQTPVYMAETCKEDAHQLVAEDNVACLTDSDINPGDGLLQDPTNDSTEETAMAVDDNHTTGYNEHHQLSKLDSTSVHLQPIELNNDDNNSCVIPSAVACDEQRKD